MRDLRGLVSERRWSWADSKAVSAGHYNGSKCDNPMVYLLERLGVVGARNRHTRGNGSRYPPQHHQQEWETLLHDSLILARSNQKCEQAPRSNKGSGDDVMYSDSGAALLTNQECHWSVASGVSHQIVSPVVLSNSFHHLSLGP